MHTRVITELIALCVLMCGENVLPQSGPELEEVYSVFGLLPGEFPSFLVI